MPHARALSARGLWVECIACVTLLMAAAGCGDSSSRGNATEQQRHAQLHSIVRASLPGRPLAVDSSGDRTWVVTRSPSKLVSAHRVGTRMKVRAWSLKEAGSDVAAVGAGAWVAHPTAGTVASYRAGRLQAQVRIPGARLLAAAGKHLWVLTTNNALVYVNADLRRSVGSELSLPREIDDPEDMVATKGGDVWIGDFAGNLARASRHPFRIQKVVDTSSVGFSALALADGKLWGGSEDYLGSIKASGDGDFTERKLSRDVTYLASHPHGGVVIASANGQDISIYRDGSDSQPWKLGDVGPISVDDEATVWVTQPATRRLVALVEGKAAGSSRPRVRIDESVGNVDGVGLGDPPQTVLKRLGQPAAYARSSALYRR